MLISLHTITQEISESKNCCLVPHYRSSDLEETFVLKEEGERKEMVLY